MVQLFKPSTWEAKAGWSQNPGWLCTYSEFQDSQAYVEKPCLQKPKHEEEKEEKEEEEEEEMKKTRKLIFLWGEVDRIYNQLKNCN